MNEQTIVLTGFMGTGKSTTAAALAHLLNRPCMDMDALIEARVGWTIPQIFDLAGEAVFRGIEQGVCLELSLRRGLVVATGGGALLQLDSQRAFLQRCFVVCLMALPETIEQRLVDTESRPLASQWKKLLAQRAEIYLKLPNRVWTDDKTPEQIAQEIITRWNASQ